jgi:hypothetical protein
MAQRAMFRNHADNTLITCNSRQQQQQRALAPVYYSSKASCRLASWFFESS